MSYVSGLRVRGDDHRGRPFPRGKREFGARGVASSALASPRADVIRLASEAEFIRGKRATVVSVDFSDSITSAAARGGLGEGKVEMTDQKPWRLEDLAFESMGDDQRERAMIDGVVIMRQDGKYWINAPELQWSNLDERDVDPALNFLFLGRQGQH
jgi:hypothetical protein